MAADKQKPVTPTLSAAFSRTNKTPLAPKLASSASQHAPRRLAPADAASTVSSRDDASTVSSSSYLSASVTPRSARSSRRDGAASPPSSTHSGAHDGQRPARPMSLAMASPGYRERSPARRADPARLARAKSVIVDNHHRPATSRPGSSCGSAAVGSPMFFHADDARSTVSAGDHDARPRAYVRSTPSSPFVYANGQEERPSPPDDARSTVSVSKRRSTGPPRPTAPVKPHAPVSSPRLKSPPLADVENRPPEAPTEGSVDARLQSTSPKNPGRRRSNPIDRLPTSHVKSCSADSTHHIAGLRETLHAYHPTVSPDRLAPDAAGATAAAAAETTPEHSPGAASNGSAYAAELHHAFPLHSPARADGSSEQALNARVERKVLDLEISNSSLLAINRTLERELRRQTAELRRYQRLTRAGRLSLSTPPLPASGAGLDAVSDAEGADGADGTTKHIDDGDGDDDDDDDDDDADDGSSDESDVDEELSESGGDDDESVDENTLSASALAERAARQRERDEKKFQLDLSKHQRLLINHQKMNQSIKRCLGWTEELIREGKRALEYSVSDVQLGGRVLAPDEMSEVGESARALLAPAAGIPSDLLPSC